MKARMPGVLNGSPVMRANMRVVSALNRKCRHDELEVDCLGCKRAAPYELGLIPYPKASPEVVAPAYVEWGRPRTQDLMEVDCFRASTRIRQICEELFPEMNLNDVVIDFHTNETETMTIWRGAAGKQFWIRLPKQTNRAAFDYNLWVLPIKESYKLIESGRDGGWKRRQIIKIEEMEYAA